MRLDGTYDERVGPYAGRWVKDADPDLIEDLRARGRLLRAESYLHSYPHCWRCGTPLLYYAKPSWYIRTSALRDRLLAANETVNWHPPHIKHGRFGNWLENNVDWAICRERYWGTPLPVWRCENGHATALGSMAEVTERSGKPLEDPHRPYVDEHTWPCPECGGTMTRVPEVIDVWFDSGVDAVRAVARAVRERGPLRGSASPPTSSARRSTRRAAGSTRCWRSRRCCSTSAPYRNVVCLGLHPGRQRREDVEVARATSSCPGTSSTRTAPTRSAGTSSPASTRGTGTCSRVEAVGESLRQFLLQLWNTYGFYVLYANAAGADYDRGEPATDLDRWALSRLQRDRRRASPTRWSATTRRPAAA